MSNPRDDVELALVAAWQKVLGVGQIGLDDNFFDIGGDSLAALDLVELIKSDFGVDLPIVELFDSPTVCQLGEVIRRGVGGRALGPLVCLRRGDLHVPPLYLFPAASGMLYFFHPIARCLPESQPVWGLQSRGLRKGEAMLPSVAEMVAEALPYMKDAHPGGPWQLIGYSLGGLLAHEAACQLSDAGEEVAWAAVLDTGLPGPDDEPMGDKAAYDFTLYVVRRFLNIDVDLEWLSCLPRPEAELELLARAKRARTVPESFDQLQIQLMIDMSCNNLRAADGHKPGYFPGKVLLLRGVERGHDEGPDDLGWSRYARDVQMRDIPGDHFTMLAPHNLPDLARVVSRELSLPATG